jgi:hypothetical protein
MLTPCRTDSALRYPAGSEGHRNGSLVIPLGRLMQSWLALRDARNALLPYMVTTER